MKVHVLGSRSGASVAVSADGVAWVLINASTDIGEQLRRMPGLQSNPAGAQGPIRAVVLTDAQLDHVGGLLALRDGPRLELFATPAVYEELTTTLPLVNVLQSYCGVRWHMLPVAGDQGAAEFRIGGLSDLVFTALAVPGLAPLHSARRGQGLVGNTLALQIEDERDGARLFYAPNLSDVGDDELAWMRGADCLLVDGQGRDELVTALRSVDARRKVLAHGPAAGSPGPGLPHDELEFAFDGMEIEL